MTAPALTVIPGGLYRPLPAMWDGQEVEWEGWEMDGTTLRGHLPDEQRACDGCGDVDGRLDHCRGWPLDAAGYSHDDRRLVAFRCMSCGHDDVLDWNGDSWCLGPEDYGPNGSSLDPADHYHHEEDDQ